MVSGSENWPGQDGVILAKMARPSENIAAEWRYKIIWIRIVLEFDYE